MVQRTLKNTIRATGVGLHTGASVVVTLKPAAENAGIVFTRTDLDPPASLAAVAKNVADSRVATDLSDPADRVGAAGTVGTIQHVMSALHGLAIDNAEVEVQGPEVPIMDGSAAPFVFLIQSAGVVSQEAPKRCLRIRKEVTCRSGDAEATLRPGTGCHFDYTDPAQGTSARFELGETAYIREISRARTFGYLTDADNPGVQASTGLEAPPAPVEDAEFLRLDSEFARHRVLDAVGDMYLFGAAFQGAYVGIGADHPCNVALVNAVLADSDAYEWVEVESDPVNDERAVPLRSQG